jgi:RNA polymerase sigma-70 factor (ECF subfamily)
MNHFLKDHLDPEERRSIEFRFLEQIRSGDKKAFENIFFLYYPKLIIFATQYVKKSMIAEDIVQDLFTYLWEYHEKITVKISLSSYLYTAIRNRSLNYLKRIRIETTWEEEELILFEESQKKIDEENKRMELNDAIQRAIDSLPGRCRLIFTLNQIDGLKYSEIAQVFNITVNTVTTQMYRAFKKLRKVLADIESS